MEQGARLWDLVWEAGRAHGMVPVGIGAYAGTARLEKSYRAHGNELDLEHDLVEAGMARPTVKDADFVGREAYLRQREQDPTRVLCTLTLEDATSSSGVRRYMMGREPVLDPDGAPLTDGQGRRSYVTSAGSGPSVGRHLMMSYLPPGAATVGTALQVEYFGERYPVRVAAVDSTPLFDPEDARMKG
jgi:glycine cleavage system aminomethyltransferase T